MNIPDDLSKEKGLEKIQMNRLKSVVALVGRNGSGKSRILDLIEKDFLSTFTVENLLDNQFDHIPAPLSSIKAVVLPFKEYIKLRREVTQMSIELSKGDSVKRRNEYNGLKRKLNALSVQINNPSNRAGQKLNQALDLFEKIIPSIRSNYIKRIKGDEVRELQKAFSSDDKSFLTFEELLENVSDRLNYNEISSISKSALSYLVKLPHLLTAQQVESLIDNSDFEVSVPFKRYQSLKKFIQVFLKKDLTWERRSINNQSSNDGVDVRYSGIWKLNNRLFDYTELSNGEKFLFAYAILFFLLDQNPQLNIKESIIILDEPELHLHPASEIALIEAIKLIIKDKGQLFIATHSLSILSHLDYDEIFLVKDGMVRHPSQSTPGASLNELMELDIRVEKLSSFLASISQWTYVNFMAQCFSHPEVIESSKSNDPQIQSLKMVIKNTSPDNLNFLLDFGAGKGRVIEQLREDFNFMRSIKYSALEPEELFHDRLKSLGAENIFKKPQDVPNDTFDFVVLCNVLHEIDLDQWVSTLNSIIRSLKDTGFLIVIEAKILIKGERIGDVGFLILDLEEIKELFNLKDIPGSIMTPESEGTITCAVLPKKDLKEIMIRDVQKCLECLENNTLTKIRYLRSQVPDSNELVRFGRLSSFLSQQYINAKLAQIHLNENLVKTKSA